MIVLDTCAIIWDALEPARLSRRAATAIREADESGRLLVADISLWEIAMLITRGRIEVDAPADAFIRLCLQARNLTVVAISPDIAALAASFGEEAGNDPADRLIAATSVVRKAKLITADKNLRRSKVLSSLW